MAPRPASDARPGGITSFIVEKGTPGFIIEREIPMLGGGSTYEIVFEDCRVPGLLRCLAKSARAMRRCNSG